MSDTKATPVISVISITLNDRDGLTRTVKSLQSQVDAPEYEHIVVDGVSEYDVAKLLAELGSLAKLYQGPDAGLYDAMNRGTDLATGDYLLYLNGGDILADPGTLACVEASLTLDGPDFLWGDSFERQLDGEVRYKRSRPMKHLPMGMISHHQAMFFRRAVLEDNAIRYNLNYRIAADYDFVLRHVAASSSHSYLPVPICVFERGGTSFLKRNQARREQFQIRRIAYDSTLFAASVFAVQWGLRTFRGLFPSGYWAIRKRLG